MLLVDMLCLTHKLSDRLLPERDQWPHATGGLDAMFASHSDPRFILSEIVRCRLEPKLFGQCFERSPNLCRTLLTLLIRHRRIQLESGFYLDVYIAAGRQAQARLSAHTILEELE